MHITIKNLVGLGKKNEEVCTSLMEEEETEQGGSGPLGTRDNVMGSWFFLSTARLASNGALRAAEALKELLPTKGSPARCLFDMELVRHNTIQHCPSRTLSDLNIVPQRKQSHKTNVRL